MNKSWLLLAALLAIGAFYWWRYKRVPDLPLLHIAVTDAGGNSKVVGDLAKGSSVIHFYAQWCGPCMKEIPEIRSTAEKFPDLDVVMITDDNTEKINNMQASMPQNVHVVHVESLKDVGVYTIPLTYILNNKQEKVSEAFGIFDWPNFQMQ